MVTLCVVVCYLHRLKLLKASLLCNLILALVSIVLKVTYISNITHIAHLIPLSLKVAEQKVKGNGWASMSQVWIAIDSRSADIHTYAVFVDWLKHLLAA